MKDAKGHGSDARGTKNLSGMSDTQAKAFLNKSGFGVPAHGAGIEQVGRYPELRTHVDAMLPGIVKQINSAASSTQSSMPYKSQWILETLISELQKRV